MSLKFDELNLPNNLKFLTLSRIWINTDSKVKIALYSVNYIEQHVAKQETHCSFHWSHKFRTTLTAQYRAHKKTTVLFTFHVNGHTLQCHLQTRNIEPS